MNKKIVYGLLVVGMTGLIQAEEDKKLYKWVDQQGNVHYSDQPQSGAKEVELKQIPTTKIEPTRGVSFPKFEQTGSSSASQANSQSSDASHGYQSATMLSPTDKQVLRNNASELTLSASLTPALIKGHSIRFFLDGRLVETAENATSAVAKEVGKGEHSVYFIVVDQQGKLLQTSETAKFHFLNRVNPAIRKKNNGG